jgi:hypothetical protein
MISLGHSSKGTLDFLHDTLLDGARHGAVFFEAVIMVSVDGARVNSVNVMTLH